MKRNHIRPQSTMNIRRNANRRKKTVVFFTVLVFVVIVSFFSIMQPRLFTEPMLQGAASWWSVTDSVQEGIYALWATVQSKQKLEQENRQLRETLDAQKVSQLNHDILTLENMELQAILGRLNEEVIVAAKVISPVNRSPYGTMVLDVGARNGVAIGNIIRVNGSVAVGTLSEVYERTSIATLFSAAGTEVTVNIPELSIRTKSTGRGAGNFEIQIPRVISVIKGMPIVLSELNSAVLGFVEEIMVEPADPFQTIRFKNPVNVAELTWVEVVLP